MGRSSGGDGARIARFDGYTGPESAVTTIEWPELDHHAIVTTGFDGSARVWDPHQPDTELLLIPMLGQGHAMTRLTTDEIVFATSLGFVHAKPSP